ncbi:MAG: uncharacterized protein H6Q43_2592 [Deltaproteobacteria bacterium]|nr:uncharacterized protein [Deltaproteobacteria bacterium]
MESSEREKTYYGRRMAEKSRAFFLWLGERTTDLLITLAGLAAVLLAVVYVHFFAPASLERHSKVVTIQVGTAFSEVARILESKGIIRDRRSFYLLARLQEAIPKVKAGEYEVHTNMTPSEVLEKLVRGDVIKYPITIPEGFNLFQIGEVLEKAGVSSQKRFLDRARDPLLIAALDLEGDSLEGYLFPDTYNFPKGYGEEPVIRQMVSRFQAVYAPLEKRAQEMGLSRKDVVILASMIEKEAMDDQERRLISAVFHNRLHRGMALQSDPTAVYGMRREKPRANNRITRGDLLKKTPYNTYQMVGLPQGPIANPGIKSLQAVLNPAEVNYLYFVSKNDRTHYFSSTLEEHNRAVALYQRRLKKPGNPDSGKGEKNPPPASRNGKISG